MPETIDAPTSANTSADIMPHQEAQRVASAFEERLKTTTGIEVDSNADVTKVLSQPKDEVKEPPVGEAKSDDLPQHIVDGTTPAKVEPTDKELEGILPPPKMSQTAAAHWANLKGIAEKRGTELARLTAELEAAKLVKPAAADTGDSEAVKNALARVAEMEAEVAISSVERSKPYKEVMAERESALALAKSYLEGTEVDPSVIDRAASLTGSKRLAVLRDADLDSTAVGAIAAHLAEFDKQSLKRDSILANHKTIVAESEAQHQAAAQAKELQLQQQEEKIFLTVLDKVKGNFPAFQKYEGNDAWNKQVDERLQLAKEYFNGTKSLEETAEITIAGVACAIEKRRADILAGKYKAVLEENAKLKAAQPGGGEAARSAASNGSNGNGNGHADNSPAAIAARFDARLGH